MKDRFRNSNQSDPSRWDSADPDTVAKIAQRSIDVDMAALYDWYWQCKRQYPGTFRGWTIEQFKNWNDSRIAALDEPAPVETTAQARKRIWEQAGKRMWNPETRKIESSRWNDASGDFELIPSD